MMIADNVGSVASVEILPIHLQYSATNSSSTIHSISSISNFVNGKPNRMMLTFSSEMQRMLNTVQQEDSSVDSVGFVFLQAAIPIAKTATIIPAISAVVNLFLFTIITSA